MADQSTDLIKGSIYKSILWFSIPLLIGNFSNYTTQSILM